MTCVTHHTGCECHEAAHAAQLAVLLTASNAALGDDKVHLLSVVAELRDRNAALQADCARLLGVVAFYAKADEYRGRIVFPRESGRRDSYYKDGDVILDGGKLARQALAAQPVEGGS